MTKLSVESLVIAKDGQTIIEDLSFHLQQRELVILLGPNGAGKSLSLQYGLGLARPLSGAAMLDGQDIYALPAIARAQKLAFLPQTRPLAWPARVYDLVALGRFAHGGKLGKLSAADAKAVERALSACALEPFASRKATTLSGGELARVHCARAFAGETPLLVADEPVAALDPYHQFAIMDLFKTYVETGGGALIVLHDVALAARYADRLIWMKDGRVVANGPPDDTLTPDRLADIYGVSATVKGRTVIISGRL